MGAKSVSRLEFTPASAGDADELLARGVRAADWQECFKTTGHGLGPALRFSVAVSDLAVSARHKGQLVALFGVAGGLVWLVGHEDLARDDLAVSIARGSLHFVDAWGREFARLYNVVDPDNALSLRWLAWLGFVIDRERPVRGPLGHELYSFWRESQCV